MSSMLLNPRAWTCSILVGRKSEPAPTGEHNWRSILDYAKRNGVTALLYYQLGAHSEIAEELDAPEWFLKSLKTYSFQLVAIELARIAELKNILTTWAEQDIRPLILKGTALAYSLYPEPWTRERCDTDVLFKSREEAQYAHEVLEAMGYRQPNAVSGDYISHQFMSYRAGGNLMPHTLDMHWRINNAWAFANTFSYEELAEKAISIPTLSPNARGLSDVHALLLACMHRAANVSAGNANRLLWLYDFHLLSEVMEKNNWEEFGRLAEKKKIVEVCLDGFQAVIDAYQSEIPESVMGELRAKTEQDGFTPHTADRSWQIALMQFRSLPGVGSRFRYLRELLFPSADYMKVKYECESRFLLPIYYLKRIAGGIPKLLRRI